MNWEEHFSYFNGVLFWLYKPSMAVKKGDPAGGLMRNGYIHVGVKGKQYLAHRVVWEMHNGAIPDGMEIDHINHIRSDNRIENLRLATRSDNQRNKTKNRNNNSGTTGVGWSKKDKIWRARIKVNGKLLYLGSFSCIDSAIKARKEAEDRYSFHKNHGDEKTNEYI